MVRRAEDKFVTIHKVEMPFVYEDEHRVPNEFSIHVKEDINMQIPLQGLHMVLCT